MKVEGRCRNLGQELEVGGLKGVELRSGVSWKREGVGVGEEGFKRREEGNKRVKGSRRSFFQRGLKVRLFGRWRGLKG